MRRLLQWLLLSLLPVGAALAETAEPASGDFICIDGNLLHLVQQQAGVLTGTRAGESFVLHQQVTRGRLRFVNGADSIVVDGDTLLLRRARNVRQTCARVPAAPAAGVVWGTLTAPGGTALAAGTRAKVLLVDAPTADGPAVEIASTEIRTTGNQVPFWFLIRYDALRALRPARPQLLARVQQANGELLYTTADPRPLPDDDRAPPSPVGLELRRSGG